MEDHFMNNLLAHLNIISRIAAKENAAETQKLIRKVIENIRYKTSRKGQILLIKDELAAVSNLIDIYGLRFGKVLEFTLNADRTCLNYYIPHYSIMTFAENSLFHAFEDMEDIRKISIDINKEGALLNVSIYDNGSGFDVNRMLSCDRKDNKIKADYGSIYETTKRICDYFKHNDIVKVTSIKGRGTKILIQMPVYIEEV